MKAIDIKAKGNVVRVYLTDREDLTEVGGDDWNDIGATDLVYDRFVDGYKDFIFDFHYLVFNCEEYIDGYNSRGCKDDMKAGLFPMVVAVPEEAVKDKFCLEFKDVMAMKNAIKIYFGDEIEPDSVNPYGHDDYHDSRVWEWMHE